MSWNEPGGDKKDPWSDRDDQNGPPDLDEAIRSLQEKIGGIFGGGKGGDGDNPEGFMRGIVILLVILLFIWVGMGFYRVDQGTEGVVQRFGKYTETTQAGLRWHLPAPIEQVSVIDVQNQRIINVGFRVGGRQQTLGSVPKEALMLTRDENIVDVRLNVQYRIKDAKDFLFNVKDPEATIKQVTESVERGVIGHSDMDYVLTEGRTEIVNEIQQEIQQVLDSYKAGILVTSVNLQDAQPPEQVQGAFEDAIKAREDKQRFINEAEAYSNKVIPIARGESARKIQEAEAYKASVIAASTGEASRFSQLLTEYKLAPDVTRKRLYIESMEAVLGKTNTVMIDVEGGNNLLYLPLDKMTQQRSSSGQTATVDQANLAQKKRTVTTQPHVRTSSRGRDVRGR